VVFGNPIVVHGSRVRVGFLRPIAIENSAPYTSFKPFLSRHVDVLPSDTWTVHEGLFLRDGHITRIRLFTN
jgi:hypothetical protein